jgi:hypothetical protein
VILEIVRLAVPVFLTVTTRLLDTPTACVAKLIGDGVIEAVGAAGPLAAVAPLLLEAELLLPR